MVWERIRFHNIHGPNIRLSDHGGEATKIEALGLHALCFSDRPLAPRERLVLRILFRGASSDFVGVGVTGKDPLTLQQNLPAYLPPGFDIENKLCGTVLRADGSPIRLDVEIVIYIEESLNRVMIQNIDSEPTELLTGVPMNRPLYVVLDLSVNAERAIISSCMHCELRPELSSLAEHRLSKVELIQQFTLKQAFFTAVRSERVNVRQRVASSTDHSPSRGNFAFVDTLLKPNHTLRVELTALKRSKPLRIVLTTKDAHHVYSEGDLSQLCETTFSLSMESEVPRNGDKLAIRIKRSGVVCISHNDPGWIDRMQVDAGLEYHVIFDLEHVSVLSMIGMTTEAEIRGAEPIPHPEKPSVEERISETPECIICLGDSRTIAVLPCFHFALCESCAHALRHSHEPKCPLCRVSITDFKRIYMA